ncbi:MAG: amino acid/polyamine/organocation transporter, superfamily [Actinomycetia bacterium]|nr:amino acid/polyamine/organocation transporter, superfamily [Actinomycetes bacterium]
MLTFVKRVLIGRPLANAEQEHQRLPKKIALATFSSDAISSTAYATEEILFVIALGGSSLALGLNKLVPIAAVVAALLAMVVFSYRKTIYAYPHGGGSYLVSKDNLGELPSLVAGASLLVDYILTVAVSISSSVAAIISIPSFRGLHQERVLLCLALVGLVTVANLRGIKESGKIFAVPTYVYIFALSGLLIFGLSRAFFGHLEEVPFHPDHTEALKTGGTLGIFLLLRGFSSGAVALSGVEAISDGVPAFEKPEPQNAARTLITMAVILGVLFFGVSVLAHHLHPYPSEEETVISQMSRAVFGEGIYYWVLQFATAGILVLAANTAYADFPRLSSIIARDGFLPRQFGNRGDRLVFSNGVVFLGAMAALLIVAFGGKTSALIPLYAIGVFTSFTLSQTGMVVRQRRLKEPGWKSGMVISGVGATMTFIVAMIVGITKFTIGAWVPIVVVPLVIVLLKTIKKHYVSVAVALEITPDQVPPKPARHTFVVLVSRVHKGVVEALNYAESLRPDHLIALHISSDEEGGHEAIHRQWAEFGFTVPLEIIDSPYRALVEPVERYLDELDARWDNDRITVVIPEFVVGLRSASNILHGQSALGLKLALLDRPNTIVTSVPFHVGTPIAED